MISKVIIKFRSNFQFQIPLQFYRIVEKVEICDDNLPHNDAPLFNYFIQPTLLQLPN